MSAWAANRPSPLAATAALILAVLFTGGLLAPWIAPYGLEDMDLAARLTAPFTSATHILGTDELGRDVLTRLLYSLRLSFVLAVCGTLIGAVLGTALGFLAARFGGKAYVFGAGHLVDKHEILIDVGDFAAAELFDIRRVYLTPAPKNFAERGQVGARCDVEQSGLAAAALAAYDHQSLVGEGERNVGKSGVVVVFFCDMFKGQHLPPPVSKK